MTPVPLTAGNRAMIHPTSMDLERATTILLTVIRDAGYHVGWTRFLDLRTGKLVSLASARHAKTGEKWIMHARTDYEAAVELAVQVGFELME